MAVVGIVLATLLGTLLGIGRFSRNAIVRGICYAYVEFFRNIPVLIQLLMWYLFFTDWLPPILEAARLGGSLPQQGGGVLPGPGVEPGRGAGRSSAPLLGVLVAWLYRRWALRRFELTGQARSLFCAPLAHRRGRRVPRLARGRRADGVEHPEPEGVRDGGRRSATPEFLARAAGPVLYTAAFIAEVVRAGIASVPHGQGEAAAAWGCTRSLAMRLVIAAAGAARDHPAAHQPVPEPHQELVAGGGHRLPGRGLDRQHRA